MTRYLSFFVAILFFVFSCSAQETTTQRPEILNPEFDKRISTRIDFSVPVISCAELAEMKDEVELFDTRKKEEYDVSHIEGARYLGYKDFDVNRLEGLPKDTKIVLYCSIGYRSEKIGEKLQEIGYTNVYNLYGSIFEWVNQGYTVVNKNGTQTNQVHTYNWLWSKWVDDEKVEKIW